MKTRKWIIGLIVILAVLCAVLAVVHLRGKESIAADTVRVEENGSTRDLVLSQEELIPVSGTIVSGKGVEKEIDAEGVSLSAIPQGECKKVKVIAKDEYKAEVMAEEFENAFLILTEEGSVRMIVFGDDNSKRDVKDVERIVVE